MRFQEDSGMDTARVPTAANAAELQRRLEERRRARTGVAAMVVDGYGGVPVVAADPLLAKATAAEFVERLAMLGLDPEPPRRPGTCRRPGCARPLPMQAASAGGVGGRKWMRMGYCSAGCWSEDTR